MAHCDKVQTCEKALSSQFLKLLDFCTWYFLKVLENMADVVGAVWRVFGYIRSLKGRNERLEWTRPVEYLRPVRP